MPRETQIPPLRWYLIPVRVALWTFVGTLICFAASLFLGIFGVAILSLMRGMHPYMTLAYRHVALPFAIVAGGIIFVAASTMEIRHYRQSKTLAAIERVS